MSSIAGAGDSRSVNPLVTCRLRHRLTAQSLRRIANSRSQLSYYSKTNRVRGQMLLSPNGDKNCAAACQRTVPQSNAAGLFAV